MVEPRQDIAQIEHIVVISVGIEEPSLKRANDTSHEKMLCGGAGRYWGGDNERVGYVRETQLSHRDRDRVDKDPGTELRCHFGPADNAIPGPTCRGQ